MHTPYCTLYEPFFNIFHKSDTKWQIYTHIYTQQKKKHKSRKHAHLKSNWMINKIRKIIVNSIKPHLLHWSSSMLWTNVLEKKTYGVWISMGFNLNSWSTNSFFFAIYNAEYTLSFLKKRANIEPKEKTKIYKFRDIAVTMFHIYSVQNGWILTREK